MLKKAGEAQVKTVRKSCRARGRRCEDHGGKGQRAGDENGMCAGNNLMSTGTRKPV